MLEFSTLSKETLRELNLVRTSPELFIFPLEQLAKLFKGNVLHVPGEIPLKTKEGVGAIYECIEFLKNVKPVGLLEWNDDISKAAQELADDIGPLGLVSHTTSSGLTMAARFEKYGDWSGSIAENIDFGSKTAKNVVLSGIVDDGDVQRGFRKNIFNGNLRYAGVGSAKHKTYGTCVVVKYAENYGKKGGLKKEKSINFEQFSKKELPKQAGLSDFKHEDDIPCEFMESNFPPKMSEDPDRPKDAISTKITKNVSIKNGKKTTLEKKEYTMKDGSVKIIEKESFEDEK